MHSHKTYPEVSLVTAGAPVLNGPDVEHSPANRLKEPVVLLSIHLIKKK